MSSLSLSRCHVILRRAKSPLRDLTKVNTATAVAGVIHAAEIFPSTSSTCSPIKVPHGGFAAVQDDIKSGRLTTGSPPLAQNARESSAAEPDPVSSYPMHPPLQARKPHWFPLT